MEIFLLVFVSNLYAIFGMISVMKPLSQIAFIGPTASGKTSLSIQYALKHNGIILSLDSLALYQDIDIASAKPTVHERQGIPHFGIDLIRPDVLFDVTQFIRLYQQAFEQSLQEKRPLVIVGGTGFYLKMLLEGISPLPPLTQEAHNRTRDSMRDLTEAYRLLVAVDPHWAQTLHPSDSYRIEKALLVYFASGMAPSLYYRNHPPQPTITQPLPIYEISTPRPELRERIALRTDAMLHAGLIDEVCFLEKRYTRAPNPMKSIGIKEALAYLDAHYDYSGMRNAIITHTAQLAKRQVTFNKSQFPDAIRGTAGELESKLFS